MGYFLLITKLVQVGICPTFKNVTFSRGLVVLAEAPGLKRTTEVLKASDLMYCAYKTHISFSQEIFAMKSDSETPLRLF